MANISHFRLMFLAVACAVVLFVMLDEGPFGASAEPAVSLKIPPKLSSKLKFKKLSRKPLPRKPSKPTGALKAPKVTGPIKPPSKFTSEHFGSILSSTASTVSNVAQTRMMYGAYGLGGYGGYGGYGGAGRYAAGAQGTVGNLAASGTADGEEAEALPAA